MSANESETQVKAESGQNQADEQPRWSYMGKIEPGQGGEGGTSPYSLYTGPFVNDQA